MTHKDLERKARLDTDERRYVYRPKVVAVLLSPGRSGSLFLCHCLSNHPQIHCSRGSTMGGAYAPRSVLGGVSKQAALAVAWAVRAYDTAVAKIGYKPPEEVWRYVKKRKAKIIHLFRSNLLRVNVSSRVYRWGRKGKVETEAHTFQPIPPVQVDLGLAGVKSDVERRRRVHAEHLARLREMGLPLLEITYEELVGGEGREVTQVATGAAKKICEFLEVDAKYPLFTRLRRVNPYPLSQIVRNWAAIKPKLAKLYPEWVEEEDVYGS